MQPGTALDRTDIAILVALQNNARLSNKELSTAIDLAPSSTHERLKRLREKGVLRGAHAEVDPTAFGVGIEALLFIELAKHERGIVDRFMDHVADVPEVRSAFLVTGPHDVIMHVVACDMRHLRDLALDRFTSQPGVTRIETSIIYDARLRHALPMLTPYAKAGANGGLYSA